VAAVETAVRRIKAGQGKLFLVGGAFNSEREDVLLNFELGGMLLHGPFKPVWERAASGKAGFVPASIGAFLVLEDRANADARGAKVYAEIQEVFSARCNRERGAAASNAQTQFSAIEDGLHDGPLAILSGASGAEPTTSEELGFLRSLGQQGHEVAVRTYGTILGHGVEAHFPLGIALAALAVHNGAFFPPFDRSGVEREFAGRPEQIIITNWGHWRGEALALVDKAGPR
ncbi:MAG: beta-ketoacyl-ACP synthase II, partial [Hyphomicrobiaceae bacterium]